ncbi:hypothetical protein MKY25_15230 [Geobacillus sp. FSL W8-0032]|uniref:hypothetical protein n=1 Tax=Geobacillus TaxID=129337 RepID=UPI0007953D65|nr:MULTISPECIES: hypothetical protein [Geobacillus]KYD30226.1 hypothetical protein B4113_0436 [Geobacillus sp. B4113_201601]
MADLKGCLDGQRIELASAVWLRGAERRPNKAVRLFAFRRTRRLSAAGWRRNGGCSAEQRR